MEGACHGCECHDKALAARDLVTWRDAPRLTFHERRTVDPIFTPQDHRLHPRFSRIYRLRPVAQRHARTLGRHFHNIVEQLNSDFLPEFERSCPTRNPSPPPLTRAKRQLRRHSLLALPPRHRQCLHHLSLRCQQASRPKTSGRRMHELRP